MGKIIRGQRIFFMLMLLVVAVPLTSNAEIYRCVDGDGKTTYTDTPCAPKEKMQEMPPVGPRPNAGQTGVSVGGPQTPSTGIVASAPQVQEIMNARVAATLAPLVQQCATTRYNAWIKDQHRFPDKGAFEAKYRAIYDDCRRTLHLPETTKTANQLSVPTAAPSLQIASPVASALPQASKQTTASISSSGQIPTAQANLQATKQTPRQIHQFAQVNSEIQSGTSQRDAYAADRSLSPKIIKEQNGNITNYRVEGSLASTQKIGSSAEFVGKSVVVSDIAG